MSDSPLPSILIAIADDELIIGHRHSEWTGWAPHLEEDVAFSSIAQDEIGHASALYELAAASSGTDANALAFGREPSEYRHALICERENREWGYTLARHWFYDTADDIRLEALEDSSNADLAALAHKMRREESYHLMHADMWMKLISQGPIEGRNRLVHALTDAFSDALGLFEPYEREEDALAEKILPVASEELQRTFMERAGKALDDLGLPSSITTSVPEQEAEFVASSSGDLIASDDASGQTPPSGTEGLGGRRGTHTDGFKRLWDVMTRTYRDVPGATW